MSSAPVKPLGAVWSMPWAILEPRMVGRRRSALLAAAPKFPFEPGDISAGRTDLLVQSPALGIGDGTGWVFRLDVVIDECVEQELLSDVLEEVLLSPAFEQAIGNIDVAQVPSARDHVRLMAAVAQARDLSQAQPALEKAHRLIVQKILHQSPVELGAAPDEPPLIDATAVPLAIGEQVEAAPASSAPNCSAQCCAARQVSRRRSVFTSGARSSPRSLPNAAGSFSLRCSGRLMRSSAMSRSVSNVVRRP